MITLNPAIRRVAALEIAPRSRLATCVLLTLGFIVSGLAGAALARRLATPGVTINIGLGHAPAIQPHAQPGLAI